MINNMFQKICEIPRYHHEFFFFNVCVFAREQEKNNTKYYYQFLLSGRMICDFCITF